MAEELTSLLDNGQKQEVLDKLEVFFDIELSPAMLALKAQVYASQQAYDKAEKTYLAVLKRKPQLVRVHSDLAQLYLIKKEYTKAREYFAKAVALGSTDALTHGQLGYLNLTLHGAYSAIDGYQRALSIEPNNIQWQRGLLAALTQAKMFEAAVALLTDLLQRNPLASELWLNKAALAFQQDDPLEALTAIEVARLTGDTDLQNLETAVKLHLQLGSYDRAVELLQQGLIDNSLDIEIANTVITWLLHKGLFAQVEGLLNNLDSRLASMDYTQRSVYFLNLAKLAESSRPQSEAVARNYELALQADPLNGSALLGYAEYFARQGNIADALMHFNRAEAIEGFEREAMLGRAQVYIDQRDYVAALNQLKKVTTKFTNTDYLQENIEALSNIVYAQGTP